MSFRGALRKIIPLGRKEAREQYWLLNQKLEELQTKIKEQRQQQETVLKDYQHLLEEVLTKRLEQEFAEHQRWLEAALLGPLSQAITEQTKWASEALEAHRQWQENIFLGIIRQNEDLSKENMTYYWNNEYEKAAIIANWKDEVMAPEFEQKYRKLIAGLDETSIRTINRILCRQKRYLSSENTKLDLFTFEEQEELRRIDDTFSKEILKISDEIYAYGKYLLPINCFEPVVFAYKYCMSEIDHIDRVKGRTIIDAGAFIGDSALIFSELEPDRIISFEPVQENVELLKKTIQLNNVAKVTIEQVALGAEKGTLKMYVCGMGSTGLPRDEDRGFYKETVDIPVVTLDQYADEHMLTNIGIIKADIEGSEPDFLRGARRIISEQRPILLICIYHNSHDFFHIKTMLEEWDLKYKFKIRKPTVVSATYEAMLIAQPE